ncbi:phage tail tape measure protein [Flavobacterium sp. N1994]|uniref:phage tail tape measure protein n=1 Tax=Flavobacterium sp. N1994 TaxID=2986827 RepID=UPI002223DC49|nr:phage tail tape measure protein [Flavobacterium sp. N1994]
MSDQKTDWILELVDKITQPVKEVTSSIDKMEVAIHGVDDKVLKMGNNSAQAFEKTNNSLKLVAANAASQAITNFGQPFLDGADGAYKFDSSLHELKAITGVSDEAIQQIGQSAKDTAAQFGSKAQDDVRAYTVLLSKLAPEIADNPVALAQMGTSVAKLAETMHNNLEGATNAASSAMNQFGVDLSNPEEAANKMDEMLNQMVASAKVGSQEVDQVAAGLDQSGAKAKAANVSFAETNAALQVMGKYGKEGAEGGIALRNVLSILDKKEFLPKEVLEQLQKAGINVDKLADKTKPLAVRLEELQKLKGKDNVLGAMFGMENTIAITGLLGNLDLLKKYTKDIESDQTALNDMAQEMGKSYQEQKDRIVSYFDNIKLSIYGATGSMLPFIDVGLQGIMGVINLAPGLVAMSQLYTMLKASTIGQTIAQWNLNAAMDANPIGAIILIVMALVAAVTVIIAKWDEWGAALSIFMGPLGLVISLVQSFRKHWDSITDAFTKGGIVAGIKRIGLVLLDALLYPVQQLLELLSKVPGLGGLAGGGAKWIKDMRHNLALDENDKKAEKTKSEVKKPEDIKKPSSPPTAKPDPTKDVTGNTSQGAAKIINMTLSVNNVYHVAKSQLHDMEKFADHVVGKINDTMKDALIASGS